MGRQRKAQVSQAAQAGIDLQLALPEARIVYASATGATESRNLGYAQRLGLWGPGTAFTDANEFVTEIDAAGLAAMELVARDMKSMGVYMARNLSFQGVEYDRITHVLSDDQVEQYNLMARAWQHTLHNFEAALEVICGGKPSGKLRGQALSAYWRAQQYFFSTILTASQMPSVLTDIEKELAAGHSCVLQLVNTQEASMERALGKLTEEDDLSDLDMTPRDQLLQLVEHCFPTQAQELYVDSATGKEKFRPVHDSQGNAVDDSEAVNMKERLLSELSTIRCPSGPLEMLIDHFGAQNVAEVTGRSRRVVRIRENGTEKTVIETRSPAKCAAEASEFQEGKRRILVFSDAGGTGRSFHASATCKNQQRRIHYLVQAGWVADQAVQGFGRTHRSHQVVAPLYKLVSTNIDGHRRFISTIARRLDQLGALTKGQRDAASTGLFKASDNLESPWARQALYKLYRDLHAGKVEGLTIEEFERQTGLELRNDNGELRQDGLPPISRFLNRLLSMTVDVQNKVFGCYHGRLMETVRKAELDGSLDIGVEVIRADRIDKVAEHVVYTDPSGAETKLVEFKVKKRTKPLKFDDVIAGREAVSFARIEFFAVNRRSGKVYAFAGGSDKTDKHGRIVPHYIEFGPLSRRSIPQHELREYDNDPQTYQVKPRWRRLETGSDADMAEARRMWDQQVKEAPEWQEKSLSLVCGVVLPIWDRLPQENTKVRRLAVSDTGERFLGREISDEELDDTLTRLGVSHRKSAESPETVAAKLLAGTHTYELVNGWKLVGKTVNGERRIEIVGAQFNHLEYLRQLAGCFFERHQFVGHLYAPAGNLAAESIRKLIAEKPVAQSARIERAA